MQAQGRTVANLPPVRLATVGAQSSGTPDHSSSEDVPLKQTGEFGKLVTMDHKISWEKYLEEQLFPLGRQKFLSWECAYYHKEAQLLLNAYVDDLKMVGKKESIAPRWKR